MQKYTKKAKKIKKNVKLFAYIKKKYYLCTVIKKQPNNQPRRQRVTSGKRVMTTTNENKTMKVFVIASTEYRANCPDMFLMDGEGNYYGVTEHSYASWRNFPKSIDYWRNAEGSDSDRWFNIDEVELTAEQVEQFDSLTKKYAELSANAPQFSEQYPTQTDYKTKKSYKEAVDGFLARHESWFKNANVKEHTIAMNEIWSKRTRLFCTFSEKVYNAIKDNAPVKYC